MKKENKATGEVVVEMTVQITRAIRAAGGMDKLKVAADTDIEKFMSKLGCDDAHIVKQKRFYHTDIE
jgi:hypothetical protein